MEEIKNIENTIQNYKNKYNNFNGEWFCPNHDIEILMYEYYKNRGEYNICNAKMNEIYRNLAYAYLKIGDKTNAENAYLESLKFNGVDVDTYSSLSEFYIKFEKYDELLKMASSMYHFCYSRVDMARYYRYLGYYFIKVYEVNLAYDLFCYSNVYCHTSDADNNIKFIKKVLKDKIDNHTLEGIQAYLSSKKIPLYPSSTTLAMVYKTAQKYEKEGNLKEAKELYIILYELTQDQEIKLLIDI